MKTKYWISLFLLIVPFLTFAQNDRAKTEDFGRIALTAYIPEESEIPAAAQKMLKNKLLQIASKNGLSGTINQRFIITANVMVVNQEITPTAPPMHAYTLEVGLYVGDGIDGTLFSSTSLSLKGVGETETKAYMAALKTMSVNNPIFKAFIDKGKNRIIEYYNSQCDFIIKKAQTVAQQNDYDAAIVQLLTVPEVCKECFDNAMDAVQPIFLEKVEKDCLTKLTAANNIWSARQDLDGAEEAAIILSTIDPHAPSYGKVVELNNKIAAGVKEIRDRDKELEDREWAYRFKAQDLAHEEKMSSIEAYRAVGIESAKHQPQVEYHIKSWW